MAKENKIHFAPHIEEFLQKLDVFVEQYDYDLLDVEKVEADQAKSGAERCGCPSCKHSAHAVLQVYNQHLEIAVDLMEADEQAILMLKAKNE